MSDAPIVGNEVASTGKRGRRTQDPEKSRANIIEVASAEFAENGLAGARIDVIAEKTKTSKHMIYYYFGDKDGLYLSCLENAYRTVREGETELEIEGLPAIRSLQALVEFTFDHHHRHEDFIRMVMIENIHHGTYLDKIDTIKLVNKTAIDRITQIYSKGLDEGVFRPDLDPLELHWQISALCFFNVSNRATFTKLFDRDFGSKSSVAALRRNSVEMVMRHILKSELHDA